MALNIMKPLNIYILLSLFSLVGLIVMNNKVNKYLNNNIYESIIIGLCILVILVLLLTTKDNFQDGDKCCPPNGISPINNAECETGGLEECSDGSGAHSVGKLINGGTHRCMGDGRAYKC